MASTNPEAFEVEGVSKSYRNQVVLKDINFSLTPGTFTLLLGANGAGKTTLLRICAGLSRPAQGKITLSGAKVEVGRIGYVGHQLMLYSNLTVMEHVRLAIDLRKLKSTPELCIEEWKLTEFSNKRVCELSRGLQFRTSIALSLLHKPNCVFLDEPTSSLDDMSLNLLINAIEATCKNGIAIVATHDVARVLSVANRVIVLKSGQIGFDSAQSADSETGILEKAIRFYREHNR